MQYVSNFSGWAGAVPLWGGEVAKKVNYLNQGGTLWAFKLPKQLAATNQNLRATTFGARCFLKRSLP